MRWPAFCLFIFIVFECIYCRDVIKQHRKLDIDSTEPQIIFFTTVRPIKRYEDPLEHKVFTILLSFWAASITDSVKLVIFSEDNYTRTTISQQYPNLIVTDDFVYKKQNYGFTIVWKSLYKTIANMFPKAPILIYFNGDVIWNSDLFKTIVGLHNRFYGNTRFCGTGIRRNVDIKWFLNSLETDKWDSPDQLDHEYVYNELYDVSHFYRRRGFDLFICSRDAMDWENMPEFVIPLVCGDLYPNCHVRRKYGDLPGVAVNITNTATVLHLSTTEHQHKDWKKLQSFNCKILANVDTFFKDQCDPRVIPLETQWTRGRVTVKKQKQNGWAWW